jgi:hypothetical protein
MNLGANAAVGTNTHPMLMMATSLPNLDRNGWISPAVLPEGTDSLQSDQPESSEFAQAEERFRKNLPSLLQQSEKLGRWVLYSAEGPVGEAAREEDFYQKYGQQIGSKYFLARIQPDPPDADVTPNWYVSMQKVGLGQGPKQGR